IVPNTNQILTLLNLNNELSGLDLPYTEILKRSLYPDIALKEFKLRFLNEIHSIVKNVLNQRKIGSTITFDLKKIQHTPFFKYSNEILDIRKEEFESSEVFRFYDKDEVLYDMTEIIKTYYGKKFLKILQEEGKLILKPEKFKKFHDFSLKLNLRLKIVNGDN
ncbi:MAG: hypothetical protein HWN81_18710, partial [Candidatus Lokiarchaeota archaeon]|nr:hypothetical protein [Candidatus Lokiarchaeota archaeon]